MAGAVGVRAQFFQLLKPIHLQPVRNAGSHARMVLMHIHAFDFQALSVKDKTVVGVEAGVPDTDSCLVAVYSLSVLHYLGDYLI